MKTANDFKESSWKNGIYSWPVHDCSMCGYRCGYIFSDDREHVIYDSGCYCVDYTNEQPRDWEDVAKQYNMQSNLEVIKKMDEFWKFE